MQLTKKHKERLNHLITATETAKNLPDTQKSTMFYIAGSLLGIKEVLDILGVSYESDESSGVITKIP